MSADFKLANHFNNSLTLKRITMMKTIKKKMNVWKVAASAVVAAGFFVAVACQDQVAKHGTETASSTDVPQDDQQKQIDSKTDDDVFIQVEEQADFPGGMEALYKYLGENIKFPEEARRQKIGGKVFVELTIKTDGTISDVKIIKSAQTAMDDEGLKNAHKAMDDEALRLVKGSPKWIPAKNKGVAVKSKFVLPLSFAVEN
jgi:TonB family protein